MTVKRTRLCYWIARPAKPGVQSNNTSLVRFTVISQTPVCSRFYHTHYVYKQNWDGSYLMNLTQNSCSYLHIFQICNLFHCVESWWNMPFKGTWHGDGVMDSAVTKLLQLWQHASALSRHTVWICIVTSHNPWMGYEYLLQNMNRPRAIHKHNPQPLETMGRVW